jgi:hypothetical protein
MIGPQQTDIGRRVVYRLRGASPKYGVIAAINTLPRVFVRFDGQHYSRGVNPADLEFFEPSSPLPPDRQRRNVTAQDGRF